MERRFTEVVESALDEPSRILFQQFAGHPLRQRSNLEMECRPDGTCGLLVGIPSPTDDPRRDMSIWQDENGIPSLQFGDWHTHADLWGEDLGTGIRAMLAYVERIAGGQILLGPSPVLSDENQVIDWIYDRVLDLSDRDDILEEVTWPGTPATAKLLSWSGTEDRDLGALVEELEGRSR